MLAPSARASAKSGRQAMRLEPLFEMVYRYADRHAVELSGAGGRDGLYWMFREGTILGERIRGAHKGMNKSTLRVDGEATGDVRGIIVTEDAAEIYYEIRSYGLAGGDLRTVVGSMFFLTGDERYRWLNRVVGVIEGGYAWDAAGRLVGTARVHAAIPEPEAFPRREELHDVVPQSVEPAPPSPATES
jgi:hypothetical protein